VGADSEYSHELAFEGPVLRGAEAAGGNVMIFAGAPRLMLRSGLQRHAPQDGWVVWRQGGGSVWRDWATEAPDTEHDHGLIEVVWRDPKSRVPLDRQRIAIVPAGAGSRLVPEANVASPMAWRTSAAGRWRRPRAR
jgi:hypothetical protein